MSSFAPVSVARVQDGPAWVEFARRSVPSQLRGLVAGRCGIAELAPHVVDRRLPASSVIPVVISFGDPQEVVEVAAGEGEGRRYGSFVAGLRPGHTRTRFQGEQGGVQVYLTPLGVQQILGLPGSAVARRVVDLEDVAPSLASLSGRLADARTWEERLDLVDQELTGLAARGRGPDPVASHTWHSLESSSGLARISHVVAQTGFSQRFVTGRFGTQVGLSPKTVSRVLRFERAGQLLSAGRALADAAAVCGYSDQSHMTREFVSLAGMTPAAWAAAAPASPRRALGA